MWRLHVFALALVAVCGWSHAAAATSAPGDPIVTVAAPTNVATRAPGARAAGRSGVSIRSAEASIQRRAHQRLRPARHQDGSRARPASITSCRTAATSCSSGTKTTGSRCVTRAMASRPRATTAGSGADCHQQRAGGASKSLAPADSRDPAPGSIARGRNQKSVVFHPVLTDNRTRYFSSG